MRSIRPTRVAILLVAAACAFADELAPDVLLLQKIKQRMQQNLARIPSYTCLETISRGRRAPDRMVVAAPGTAVPFRRFDTVRLEVAEIGSRELFARPGEHDFQEREITELVFGGLIGDGMFSPFARSIFLGGVATYSYRGEEMLDGRPAIRFDYKIPQMSSGYRFGTPYGRAIVGYSGSFWVDPENYDALRIEITADDIPPELRVAGSRDRIDFARVHIGGSDALLPQTAEMLVWQGDRAANRNQISFTHCREYGVEALLKFDDAEHPTGMQDSRFVDLPVGLQLMLALEDPIDAEKAHIGDVIAARVDADAMHKKGVVVPKDAVVTGRVRRIEIHKEGWPYVLLGLEFTQVEFNGKQARFFAELEKLYAQGPRRQPSRELPGVGLITQAGNHLQLPKGTRLVWKTLPYDIEPK